MLSEFKANIDEGERRRRKKREEVGEGEGEGEGEDEIFERTENTYIRLKGLATHICVLSSSCTDS